MAKNKSFKTKVQKKTPQKQKMRLLTETKEQLGNSSRLFSASASNRQSQVCCHHIPTGWAAKEKLLGETTLFAVAPEACCTEPWIDSRCCSGLQWYVNLLLAKLLHFTLSFANIASIFMCDYRNKSNTHHNSKQTSKKFFRSHYLIS